MPKRRAVASSPSRLKVPGGVIVQGHSRGRTGTPTFVPHASMSTGIPFVELGGDNDTLAFGSRLENVWIDCQAKAGSIGVYTEKVQEQSGLRHVAISGYMDKGFYANGTAGGGTAVEHFTLEDVELYADPSSTNPGGFRSVTCGSVLLNRVTVFDTNGSMGSGSGFDFDDTQFTAIDLHCEYWENGVVIYNGSSGSIFGIGGGHCNQLINYASSAAEWFMATNVGMADSGGITGYLQDQVTGQYIQSPVAFYASGQQWTNGLRMAGYKTVAGVPTTTQFTEDKAYGIHKNSSDSKVYLAYNDGGVIKKVELT
jgi:hypothetical protein